MTMRPDLIKLEVSISVSTVPRLVSTCMCVLEMSWKKRARDIPENYVITTHERLHVTTSRSDMQVQLLLMRQLYLLLKTFLFEQEKSKQIFSVRLIPSLIQLINNRVHCMIGESFLN